MARISQHKLKQYLNRPDGELDLHGLRVLEAGDELRNFLTQAERRQWSKVKIITGRGLNSPEGRGVLKEYVEGYLGREGYRFREAAGADGGAGCLVVDIT